MSDVTVGTWQLDPTHTTVGFAVRHIMSKVRGSFGTVAGALVTAENITDSRVDVEVDLSSIETGTEDRDNHLRSSDFFDVETHPKMNFVSTDVIKKGDTDYIVQGDLTIKGVTKPLELAVDFLGEGKDPWGGTRVGIEATGTISRKEFGIDFNIPIEGDRVMIGDKISIQINAEAVLQA